MGGNVRFRILRLHAVAVAIPVVLAAVLALTAASPAEGVLQEPALPSAVAAVDAPAPAPVAQPAPPAPGSAPSQPAPVPTPPAPPTGGSAGSENQAGPADEAIAEGLELLEQGNMPGAIEKFEKALTLDPNSSVAHSRLAYIRFRKADYTVAATHAEAALRIDPSDSLADLILGRAHEALGEPEKALQSYAAGALVEEKAVTHEQLQASSLCRYLRAMVHIQRGEYSDEVLDDLRNALRVYPKNGYVHYEYGLALIKTGRDAEAKREYGLELIGTGKDAEAREASEAAEDLIKNFAPPEKWVYPNRRYYFLNSNLAFWRSVLLRRTGNIDEALTQLEALMPTVEQMAGATTPTSSLQSAANLEGKIENSFHGAHYEAALAYQAKGDSDKAAAVLKKFLKLNLPDPELNQQVKELQKHLK